MCEYKIIKRVSNVDLIINVGHFLEILIILENLEEMKNVKKVKSLLHYLIKTKRGRNIAVTLENEEKRPYKCIPLYTESEMENALVDNSDDVLNACIGRQAKNGYVSRYKEEWVVGRNRSGNIVKTKEKLLHESCEMHIKIRNRRIWYTENHALYGKDLKKEMFCKFTYDIENQKKFSTHVELVKEYKEAEIIEDSGVYGGIHFVPLEHIEICLDCVPTCYGNKIALIEPLEDEVYYEYDENVFVGNKVFVSKVMELNNVETWKNLDEMTNSVKKNKEMIYTYLKKLNDEIDCGNYEESMNFVLNL